MKLTVKDNILFCNDIKTHINHMECNDECAYFRGCAVIKGEFVIECACKKVLAENRETVAVS